MPQGNNRVNLSECYKGMDQLMGVVMEIGTRFETWACAHVAFEEWSEVWPYIMKDRFGAACVGVQSPTSLAEFDDDDCLRVALQLRLPVKVTNGLPVPIVVTAPNPLQNSAFVAFRIQTVRRLAGDDIREPFTWDDDPFDDHFSPPHVALYGVGSDDLLEHIADRRTYADAVSLAQKIAPGAQFPKVPIFHDAPLNNSLIL